MFSALRPRCRRLGLEKIKTIGDAYMVAGGLPEPLPDHAAAVAGLALAMLERRAKRLGTRLSDRLQIRDRHPHRPGRRRHHRHAQVHLRRLGRHREHRQPDGILRGPDRIHVSAAVRRVLGDVYNFEPRGPLEIKGKGIMETFFLLARHE